jgi:RsiW-degrading membrane proteinase PrsW (M82 family)
MSRAANFGVYRHPTEKIRYASAHPALGRLIVCFTIIIVVAFALLTFKGYDGDEPSFTNLLRAFLIGLVMLMAGCLVVDLYRPRSIEVNHLVETLS